MRKFVVVAALVAAACRGKQSSPLSSNLAAENKVAVRPVTLYYQGLDMLLGAELRNVALPENPAAAMPVVVRELLKPPLTPNRARSFPADTVVRAAYLLPEGTAFVDLGGPTLTRGWGTGSHEEMMAIYAVVQSVTANFPEVKRVRILVNGEPAETLAGHINISRSLAPIPSLIAR